MIQTGENLQHWNYFLALEADLKTVSRYIEFDQSNFEVYSIELAHLLLASSSEVDVLLKGISGLLDEEAKPQNIKAYHKIVSSKSPDFLTKIVMIPRFNMTLNPWESWTEKTPPLWWNANNMVKHHRNTEFKQASLKNVLNSMAALYTCIAKYYKLVHKYSNPLTQEDKVNDLLKPPPELFKFEDVPQLSSIYKNSFLGRR